DEDYEAEAEAPLVLGVEPLELGNRVVSLLLERAGGEAARVFADPGVGVERYHFLVFRQRGKESPHLGDQLRGGTVGTTGPDLLGQRRRALERLFNRRHHVPR